MAVGSARPPGTRVSRITYGLEDRVAEFPVLVVFIGRAIIYQGLAHSERTARVRSVGDTLLSPRGMTNLR